MRRALMLLVMVAGCHPSTSIENTMPVANLQTYRSVALRVHTNAFAAQGRALMLEQQLTARLRQSCGFESVGPVGAATADIVMDANITNMGRGGGGMISNPNVATIEVLLVLTDGQSKELLGTSKIRGRSATALINNAVPENEAIGAVAQAIAGMLAKSGCSGPRIARATPPDPVTPVQPTGGSNAQPDESHRPEAEAANDEGKEKLYAADVPSALASFEKAVSLYPDPRYEFNVCLAYSAQEQWKQATESCKKARGMNPQPALASKIDDRLAQLAKAK